MSVILKRWQLKCGLRSALPGSVLIFLISCISTDARATATGIYVAGVDTFPTESCCNGGYCITPSNLGNSQANSQGFLNQMLASPNPWQLTTSAGPYFNYDCWTTDFYDPEKTGLGDDDTSIFDKPSNYASYVTAHGICPDTNTPDFGTQCWHDSECANYSPPSGERQPGTCVRWPLDNYGRCRYTSDRRIVLANRTVGPSRCGVVNYTSGTVKWGENPYIQGNPGWAGAGTNGGTHLAVVDISCAELSGRHQEIFGAFAGMHMLATAMVVKGDVANVADRGPHFASHYTANAYGIVSNAWNDTLNSEDPNTGNFCHNRANDQWSGGGLGFNGCGAQSVTAMGATAAEAHSLVGETWYDLRWDGRSATGASYYEQWYACNYDCYTWTFNMP